MPEENRKHIDLSYVNEIGVVRVILESVKTMLADSNYSNVHKIHITFEKDNHIPSKLSFVQVLGSRLLECDCNLEIISNFKYYSIMKKPFPCDVRFTYCVTNDTFEMSELTEGDN